MVLEEQYLSFKAHSEKFLCQSEYYIEVCKQSQMNLGSQGLEMYTR